MKNKRGVVVMKIWNYYIIIIETSLDGTRTIRGIMDTFLYNLMNDRNNDWRSRYYSNYPEFIGRFKQIKVYAPNADIAKKLAWHGKEMCFICDKVVDYLECNDEQCCKDCFDKLFAKEYERIAKCEAKDHWYVFGEMD